MAHNEKIRGRIPRPGHRDDYDMYRGAEERFLSHRGGVTDELQVRPTEFLKELLEMRAINGVTPERDIDTISFWNRYKKEQYLRRGKGGWQSPTLIGESAPYSEELSPWAWQPTEVLDPKVLMKEAINMESRGSAEGTPLTKTLRRDNYYSSPKFKHNIWGTSKRDIDK